MRDEMDTCARTYIEREIKAKEAAESDQAHKAGAWAQSVPAVADLGLTKHWCCFSCCILVHMGTCVFSVHAFNHAGG